MVENLVKYQKDGKTYLKGLTGKVEYEIIDDNKAVLDIKLFMKA